MAVRQGTSLGCPFSIYKRGGVELQGVHGLAASGPPQVQMKFTFLVSIARVLSFS